MWGILEGRWGRGTAVAQCENYMVSFWERTRCKISGLLILVLLIGCGSENNAPNTQQPLESTPTDVITENGDVDTPTPEIYLSPEPTTSQPYSTPTIFPVLTPSGEVLDYQLKDWSESSAIDLVDKAERYPQEILQADMDWFLQRSGSMQAYEIVDLAANEALLRYPDTQSRERLEWLIVLSESLLSAVIYRQMPPNDRISNLLEAGLNSGSFELSGLDEYLNSYGFELRRQTEYGERIPRFAKNLFGDGRVVPLIVISRLTNDSQIDRFVDSDGYIFAIRVSEDGAYIPLLIESGWFFSSSGFKTIKVADVTGDDIPEIEVVFYVTNGSMTDFGISVWQWRENNFVDLVDEIRIAGPSQWHFGVSDIDTIPILETNEYINGVGGPITTTYAWDGNIFEPVSIEFTNWPDDVAAPSLPNKNPIQQNTPTPENGISENDLVQMELLLFENANTEMTISIVEPLLSDPDIESVGGFTRPQLYYLLGLAYELAGNKELAVKNYWQLWQEYPDSSFVILAQAKLEER